MTNGENPTAPMPSAEAIQQGWGELTLKVAQLEAETAALHQENKALRTLLERTVEHRQKSHTELVLLLTNLVSKLPLNDVGVIVSRLVEHNANVSEYLATLVKGTTGVVMAEPTFLKTFEQTKRDLLAAVQPAIEELLRLEPPLECELFRALANDPEQFFSPRLIRANRCFVKGQVPRERVLREFGPEALVCFQDITTDPKLNPHPKPEEIVLMFRNDFESFLPNNPGLAPERREQLMALYQRVQQSKASSGQARAQRDAFFRLSFLIELLHYYEHQNTETPDVIFAQRLPAVVEQIVVPGPEDPLEEKPIELAESLLRIVIRADHRHMVINNLGKAGGNARTLKYVLRLRDEKWPEPDQTAAQFVKHLLPAPPEKPPTTDSVARLLRLLQPDMRRLMVRTIMFSDRIRKDDAEALGRAVAAALGLTGIDDEIKALKAVPPEVERKMAWGKVKDLIVRHADAGSVTNEIRQRLHARYDADEIRQSWITLTEADPMSFIRVFCQLPYLPGGKTDPIARTVLEVYVTRLLHEKYAATYRKVANSLRSIHSAKPDSPTLVTFLTLVKWVDPHAAEKLAADIGMPAQAA